jgi:NADH-quinone oxidoreductase subunit H
MRSPRAALPLLLGMLAFACLFAMGRGSCTLGFPRPPQQLVRVSEVVPWEVEAGDRVTIFGDGFPARQSARVTFRGTLHRPGEDATRGAEIAVLARVVAATRLEFALDDATLSLFSGAGGRATHTTFEGDVEVAFAPAAAGAPPIAGYLGNLTLDVRPHASASTRERQQKGERLLAWLGIEAAASPPGLVIQGVAPGSRAQAAGIVPGEVITGFDGVRVESAADVVPPPAERAATIDFQEEGPVRFAAHGQTRIVALEGFRSSSDADFAVAWLSVLSALGIVFLFSAPPPSSAAAALRSVVSRLRVRSGVVPNTLPLAREAWEVARHAFPPRGPTAIADACVYALLATLAFDEYCTWTRLDVWFLFVAAVACLAAVAFVARHSMRNGAAAAADVAWRHAPAAAAVTCAVLLTGSLRLREIANAQGGWPCDWLAFQGPGPIVSAGLLLASARIEPGSGVVPSPLALAIADTTDLRPEGLGPWLETACRVCRIVVAGLVSALFLGAWRLPGVSAVKQCGSPSLQLVGALLLLAKTSSLVVLTAWMRWLLPIRDLGRPSAATSRAIALFPTLALAATGAWIWWAPPPAVQHLVSMSLSIALSLTGVAVAYHLRHGLTSVEGDAHLSPFL